MSCKFTPLRSLRATLDSCAPTLNVVDIQLKPPRKNTKKSPPPARESSRPTCVIRKLASHPVDRARRIASLMSSPVSRTTTLFLPVVTSSISVVGRTNCSSMLTPSTILRSPTGCSARGFGSMFAATLGSLHHGPANGPSMIANDRRWSRSMHVGKHSRYPAITCTAASRHPTRSSMP